MRLVLASASPRRTDILRQMGYAHLVRPVSVDESARQGEPASAYLERIADDKAEAARAEAEAGDWLLVADTLVTIDDLILGKPESTAEHLRTLALLSGRTHQVMTRFVLSGPSAQYAQTVVTEVNVQTLSKQQMEAYVALGEGTDKAGGYAIQGCFAKHVVGISGSYTNVVGLPAHEVAVALERMCGASQ